MGYTKGPWRFIANYDNITTVNLKKEGILGTIKSSDDWDVARIWQLLPKSQAQANARLIAESPNLLEACKFAHLLLLQIGDNDDYTERTINDLAAAIRAVKGE